MKRLSTILFAFAIYLTAFAQAPEGVNYQAVARDAGGDVLASENLTVRMTIKESGPAGTIVYQETHNASTNDFGLFSITIGQGSVVSGTFSNIDWGNASHFLQVEIDDGGGYTNLGTTQLVSVPYALYAKESGNGGTSYNAGAGIDITGNTITNTAPDQTVTLTGSGATTISGTYPNFTISSTDADNQSLSISGNTLTISGGNSVTLPGGTTYTAGTGIDITGSTISNSSPDQTVTLTGSGATTISGTYPNFTISSTDDNTTYTAGTGLNLSGTQFSAMNTVAMWNANELQGNAISTSTPSVGDFLRWDGSEWIPEVNTDTSHWYKNGHHLYTENDSVGIGTSTPLAALHVDGGQDVLFGDTTAGFSGPRLMWIADKGAFRAGRVINNYWDYDSIGNRSVAFGFDTKAIGSYSAAMGSSTTASGYISTAMGSNTTASGFYSTAMGRLTTASGNYSTAMGRSTTAFGYNSTAMGRSTTAPSGYEMAVGRFNTDYTPNNTNGWDNTDRLFVVGNGTGIFNRSDAFVILKNGQIGIGNSNPDELLHIGTTTGARLQIGSIETIEDGGANILEVRASLRPISDGGYSLGGSFSRWNQVYAVNGTINTSDARDKEAIEPLTYGLETVLALNPVSYRWKNSHDPHRKLGLVAQELMDVVPEVVADQEYVITDEKTGEGQWVEAEKLGVYYSDLIPVLVRAIQEQQTEIETLQEKNRALQELEEKYQAIEQRLSAVEPQ